MTGEREFNKDERDRFIAGISGQCTNEDRPVSEVIIKEFNGNANAYIAAMLRYAPETERFLNLRP